MSKRGEKRREGRRGEERGQRRRYPRVTRQETERGTDKHLCMGGENEREGRQRAETLSQPKKKQNKKKLTELNIGSLFFKKK